MADTTSPTRDATADVLSDEVVELRGQVAALRGGVTRALAVLDRIGESDWSDSEAWGLVWCAHRHLKSAAHWGGK